MRKNTGENKKVLFFYYILVDFIIAIQIAAVYFFSESSSDFSNVWDRGSLAFSFLASFLVFIIFSGVFENAKEIKRVIQSGLIFLILGSLVNFFLNETGSFVFGTTVCGLGAGMVMAGQLGIIRQAGFEKSRFFSLAGAASFISGLIFGPAFVGFLAGPALPELKTSFILGSIFPALTMLELSLMPGVFFEKARLGIAKGISLFRKEKKRMAILGVGYSVAFLTNYPFDYILYPYVIWKLGILRGGIIMSLLSFIVCYLTMLFYDWSKKDWLGIEAIKKVREYSGRSFMGKLTSWMLKKSDPVILVFLSIQFDPFITTAYMRKGVEAYNGMNRRDWTIFISSFLVANAYWIAVAYLGVSAIEYFWKILLNS